MFNVDNTLVAPLIEHLQLLSRDDPFNGSNKTITADTVVLDGFNKFPSGKSSSPTEKKAKAISAFLTKEASINTDPHWWRSLSDGDIERLHLAKAWCKRVVGMKWDTSSLADLFYPGPGESFFSQKGRTSFLDKFEGKWSVTPDAAVIAAEMVCSTRLLRRHVCEKYSPRSQKAFMESVVQRFTLVSGDRCCTVPKNEVTDRMIGVGPLWNVMLQKAVGKLLRRRLFAHTGFDLNAGEATHRKRILSEQVSTIDLSNASNSLGVALVDFLFPTPCVELLLALRSPVIRLPSGVWHSYRMLSPMGNGYTFECMSVVLTALARTFDPKATVYGDDIVISDDCAEEFVAFLERCTDFRVNHKKTFIKSPVKESCGAFVVAGEEIVRYDFKKPVTQIDVNLLCNKVGRILSANQVSDRLRSHLRMLHIALKNLCPHRGPKLLELHGYYAEDAQYRAVVPARKARRMAQALQLSTETVDGLVYEHRSVAFHNSSVHSLKYYALLRTRSLPSTYVRNRTKVVPARLTVSGGRVLYQHTGGRNP